MQMRLTYVYTRRLLVLLMLFACGVTFARTLIVVSLHPYAALLEQIVGDDADVVQLLPSGASPHTFDPTPSQAASIANADLIVMNGNIDAWLESLVRAAAPRAPRLVVLDALSFDPIGDENTGVNPHVWLDPVLMAQLMPPLAAALTEVDPANAEHYRANAEAMAQRLQQLDAQLRIMLDPIRGAAFVPFHDAWPYFARRYDLDLVVTIEPFPGREPSARFVAEAVAAIRAAGAKAVFSERQLNARPAQVVAEAAGVALAVLDPLGNDDQSYDELLLDNAATLLSTLGPTAP